MGLLGAFEDAYGPSSGLPAERGARLAVEEINEAGGIEIDGRWHRVRLISRPYEPRPDMVTSAARALFNQDSIHVLVGPQFSAHAIPVGALAESTGVPMVSPMSSNPETTRGREFVFRMAALDAVQSRVMAEFAIEELQTRTAAVVFDRAQGYSAELAAQFESSFQASGGRMVATESYTTDRAEDFSEQLGRVAAAAPEALYLPNTPGQMPTLLRQVAEAGIEAELLGSDTWDTQDPNVQTHGYGAYVTHQWHYATGDPTVSAFLDRFNVRYQARPRTTAAMTYDAVMLLADVIRDVQSLDGRAVAEGLSNVETFRGVTGVLRFRGRGGNPDRSIVVSQMMDTVEVRRVVHP